MSRYHEFSPMCDDPGEMVPCTECDETRHSYCHRVGSIDSELVEAVEDHCGMGHQAWDTIDPREIILAAIECYKKRN